MPGYQFRLRQVIHAMAQKWQGRLLFPRCGQNCEPEVRSFLRGIGCLAFGFAALVLALFVYFFSWSTHVYVDGVVVDRATQEPVPNARVLVTLSPRGLKVLPMIQYGLVADGKGRFHLDRKAPRRFRDVTVAASSPSNLYGYVRLTGWSEDAVVYVEPLSAKLKEVPGLRYERFGDGWPYEFEFVGESWPMTHGRR